MPLLRSTELRIDRSGAVLFDDLSFESTGDRLGLVGESFALMAVLSREAQIARGTLEIQGVSADRALERKVVGLCRHQELLPRGHSVHRYLTRSARLLGVGTRLASRAAEHALEELGLQSLSSRRVEHLSLVERRSVGLARSVLHDPPVLVAELPLYQLDDAAQTHLSAVLERATHRRRSILSFIPPLRPSPELHELARMEQLIVFKRGKCVAQGPPAELLSPGKRYVLSVGGDADLLRKQLDVRSITHSTPHRVWGPSQNGSATLLVELSSDQTADQLLEATASLGLVVLEMTPLDALVW